MRTLEDLERAFERGLRSFEQQIVERNAHRMGEKIVREVARKTPVRYGYLQRNWFEKVEHREGDTEIYVYNNLEYAEPVNNGHRIVKGGQTVGYADGHFMLERGIETYQTNDMQRDMERMLRDLREAMR